jgi:hypothetical protein
VNLASRAVDTLRSEGIRSLGWRSVKWLSTRFAPQTEPLSTIHREDAIAVDWTKPRQFNRVARPGANGRHRVAWIISPPSPTSGGHQNAFRFMRFLEQAGHELTVYLYAAARFPVVNVEQVRRMMTEEPGYVEVDAELRLYDPVAGLDDGLAGVGDGYDAVIASDWEAAYAAYRYPGDAKRFYFAQDFEPYFFAASSDYVLAENTYRFGFHGITAGRWLAEKLSADYGMTCDAFEFAVDTRRYRLDNVGPRPEIVFYVRPPTPRRATEFGLLALSEVNRLRPGLVINLVGWDMSGHDVPFPHVNHGAVDIDTLNAIYNRCAAGLVLSLTNMSLLPLELMASGTVPVVNDAPNTRGVFDSPYIEYVPMSPEAIAERLIAVVDRPDAIEHAAELAASVDRSGWSDPASTFISQFEAEMRRSG